jgi:predicted RNA binding protein YcfA (HicA-like mRNA interferase family)
LSQLPVVSGQDVIRALEKAGYAIDRQKGSHVILREIGSPFRRITVPDHKEIAKGILRAIIRQTGLTVEQFANLIRD